MLRRLLPPPTEANRDEALARIKQSEDRILELLEELAEERRNHRDACRYLMKLFSYTDEEKFAASQLKKKLGEEEDAAQA
jgi:peroxiredoxin family protein